MATALSRTRYSLLHSELHVLHNDLLNDLLFVAFSLSFHRPVHSSLLYGKYIMTTNFSNTCYGDALFDYVPSKPLHETLAEPRAFVTSNHSQVLAAAYLSCMPRNPEVYSLSSQSCDNQEEMMT